MGKRRSAREYFGTIKADIDQKMALEKAAKAGDPEAALTQATPSGRPSRR